MLLNIRSDFVNWSGNGTSKASTTAITGSHIDGSTNCIIPACLLVLCCRMSYAYLIPFKVFEKRFESMDVFIICSWIIRTPLLMVCICIINNCIIMRIHIYIIYLDNLSHSPCSNPTKSQTTVPIRTPS